MRRQLGISQCFDDEHAAAFAPGFESVRTINTGPVDPSTNVDGGTSGNTLVLNLLSHRPQRCIFAHRIHV